MTEGSAARHSALRMVLPGTISGVGVDAVVDSDSFDRIYRDHAEFVWAVLRRLGLPEASAEDALQDVFLVVHRRLHTFEGRSTLRSWIYGVVIRVARAHRRRSRWRRLISPVDPDEIAQDAEKLEAVERSQAVALLDQVLSALPDERREVFVLAEIERLSAPEIAEVMGCKLNTVYSRLRLARQDFERELARLRARDTWRQS